MIHHSLLTIRYSPNWSSVLSVMSGAHSGGGWVVPGWAKCDRERRCRGLRLPDGWVDRFCHLLRQASEGGRSGLAGAS